MFGFCHSRIYDFVEQHLLPIMLALAPNTLEYPPIESQSLLRHLYPILKSEKRFIEDSFTDTFDPFTQVGVQVGVKIVYKS